MKFTGQSKDGVIESLLRAYVSRPSNPQKACTEFDADQANAYIERQLTGSVRSQYEQHLSECTGCRKNVVALIRLAQADVVSTIPPREVPQSTWLANIRQSFGILTRPQWALAATALLVLAISLPLVLTMNRSKQDSPAAAQQIAAGPLRESTPEPATPQASLATLASARTPTAETDLAQESKQRKKALDKFDGKPELVAKNPQPATGDAASAVGFVASADLSKKQEGAVAHDESRSKSASQVAQPQAQAPSAPGAQAARNETLQARQQQQPTDKDSAQQIPEPKSRADQESTEKEKSKRAEEAVSVAAAPAPPTSADAARDRASRRPPSKLALRDPKTGEAVKVEERKISGKHFLFTGGAWTDKDYDPNKDLPIVTVIRDSNVYKELLSKHSGLKPIMALFTASERAIIVYKGMVYKLVPQ